MLAPISPTDYHDHDDDDVHGISGMLIIIKVVINLMFPGNEFMVDKNSDHQRGWGGKMKMGGRVTLKV